MEAEYLSSLSLLAIVLVIPVFRKNIFRKYSSTPFKSRGTRIDFFDFLKGVAIIGVILVHVLFYFGQLYPNANQYWIDIANNLVRYSIGFFFLVSGILLREEFSSRGSTIAFYKPKLTRIIIPYAIANIFIWRFQNTSFSEFLSNLVTGMASVPYYFVIVLIQLYLLYPLLVRYRNRNWFLPGSLFVSYIFYIVADPSPLLGFVFFGKFLFFFCYGIAMRDQFLESRFKTSQNVWIAIILLYLVTLFSFPGHYYNERYFYVLSLFHLLFLSKDRIEQSKVYKTITSVGNNSLWIFLTHMSVVSYTYYLTSNWQLPQFILIGLNILIAVPVSIVWGKAVRTIYEFFLKKALLAV